MTGPCHQHESEYALITDVTGSRRDKFLMSKEIVMIPEVPILHDPFTRSLTMETCQRSKVLSDSVSTASTIVAAD